MSKLSTLILLASVLAVQACATMSRGGTDYLRVDSIPQGAKVTTSIETSQSRKKTRLNPAAQKQYRTCAPTPCLLEVGRRQAFAIKIEHDGYEPAEIAIHGEIPLQTTNLDMSVPAGSMAANMGMGVASGAAVGTMAVAYIQAFNPLVSAIGLSSAPTSGIVAGATAAGAGFGVAMVGIDFVSGSYENIYPNPVIIKLAPKGAPTRTDPNMLMFKLKQAKKRIAHEFCFQRTGISPKKQKENCAKAKEIDRQRDIENAEILANEQHIKDFIKALKKDLKAQSLTAKTNAR